MVPTLLSGRETVSQIRKYAIAGGTFSAAMAIGFVMQNGDALASLMVDDEQPVPAVEMAGVAGQANVAVLIPEMSEPAPQVAEALNVPAPDAQPEVTEAPVMVAAADPDTALGGRPVSPELAPQNANAPLVVIQDAPALATPAPELDAGVICVPDLAAEPGPAATVALTLVAPCNGNATATVHHQGMIFTIVTDESGMAQMLVPALSENAVFIAELPGGAGAAAIVTVPDVALYDRAVLQWQGETGMQLHALEYGAGYDEEGHVWAAAMRDPVAAADGQQGFMTRLGAEGVTDAMMAEVYTFPTGMAAREGRVELSVEAQVLETTCGREIAAQTIQISPGVEAEALDLTMTLPGCEAVGEYLVLKNMLESLTLAAR